MDTREIAAEYRLSHWSGILRERAESGLSVGEYCRKRGYHENVYYYWQRKLREAALAEMCALENPGAATPAGWALCGTEPKPDVSPRTVPQQTTAPDQLTAEVSGTRITVGSEYPAEKLVLLLRELSRPC